MNISVNWFTTNIKGLDWHSLLTTLQHAGLDWNCIMLWFNKLKQFHMSITLSFVCHDTKPTTSHAISLDYMQSSNLKFPFLKLSKPQQSVTNFKYVSVRFTVQLSMRLHLFRRKRFCKLIHHRLIWINNGQINAENESIYRLLLASLMHLLKNQWFYRLSLNASQYIDCRLQRQLIGLLRLVFTYFNSRWQTRALSSLTRPLCYGFCGRRRSTDYIQSSSDHRGRRRLGEGRRSYDDGDDDDGGSETGTSTSPSCVQGNNIWSVGVLKVTDR